MSRHFGILKKEQDKQLSRHNPEAPLDNDASDYFSYDKPPHWHTPDVTIGFVLCALVAVILIALGVYAFGHDYKHPEKQQWYESLRSADKAPCCDGQEANHIADMDWDTQCAPNNFGEAVCHYRVFLYDRWWEVPARAVVDGPNRDGSALVWDVPTKKDNKVVSTFIRCFMPGAGG